MKISVIIPAYNAEHSISKTLASLKNQTFKDFELIIIDDNSPDKTVEIAKKYTKNIITHKTNTGPAVSRNHGIKKAKADIIAFIDSDCIASKNWLENINKEMKKEDVIMGKVTIPPSTTLGNAISALGFPAGANLGFEKVWRVSKAGYTDHISSCNFAIKKSIFKKYGCFDESFPLAGAEDSELSYRLTKNKVKIKYAPSVHVFHEPRKSLKSFVKWQIIRGRSNYHFKQKIGSIGGFIKLRAWYAKNVLKKHWYNPLVIFLLFLSFYLQQRGYFKEKWKSSKS